jgi:hypothetical protein
MEQNTHADPTQAASLPHVERQAELARRLDCLTEPELCLLGGLKPNTPEQWRKRGKGPAYVWLGNTVLYPRESLADFLRKRAKTPADGGLVKGTL